MSVSEIELKRSFYDENRYYPLSISSIRETTDLSDRQYRQPDLWITVEWQDQAFSFFVEIERSSSAATIRDAIAQLRDMSQVFGPANPDARPLLMIPYISEPVLDVLRGTGVSVIDASGNYFLQSSNLLAVRLDQPKRFRDNRGIKNPYKGDSSIVARVLLLEPDGFASNSSLLNRVTETFPEGFEDLATIAPSTVSKALSTLEEDLIVDSSTGLIKLLQPALLLDKLSENYEPPDTMEEYRLRISGEREEVAQVVDSVCGRLKWMWSGESSAEKYTPTTPPQGFRVYAKEIRDRQAVIEREDRRFANCHIVRPSKKYIFAGKRVSEEIPRWNWASQLETYLDLSRLDKRERELAEPIRRNILRLFG